MAKKDRESCGCWKCDRDRRCCRGCGGRTSGGYSEDFLFCSNCLMTVDGATDAPQCEVDRLLKILGQAVHWEEFVSYGNVREEDS